ncbi:MAG TPA: hypothetical protein VFN61_08635 [Acidimicrobiales bacterium]|nr:hypothetical protein [Acidimicrobiales bacterium]
MKKASKPGSGPAGDEGVALLAAMLLVLMVTMIGTVAVAESLNGSHRAASTAKGLQTVSAARAGLDAAIADVQSQLTAGAISCPSTYSVNAATASGAVNGASGESYVLAYKVLSSAPSSSEVARLENGTDGATLCSSTGSILTSAQLAAETGTFYIALASQGHTTSSAYNWSTSPYSIAVMSLTPEAGASFTNGLYGGQAIDTPGNMVMTGSGATYTNGQLQCSSANHYWAGDVWATGGVTAGDCQIRGNLYVAGSVSLTGCTAPDVTGGIYATGSVGMSGGCEVEGDIVANGDVYFYGGGDTLGNIDAFGTDASSPVMLSSSLASPLSTGGTITALAIESTTISSSMPAGTQIVVQYGAPGSTWHAQTWTTSAIVSSRSPVTSIPVSPQVPNYSYPAGSEVESLGTPCGTSVCLTSGAGHGWSYQANNVYTTNGTYQNTNAPIHGSAYVPPSGAWSPACPVPAGSGVTCTGGELAPLPIQLFPTFGYPSTAFPSGTWTYYDDSGDSCTSNPNGPGLANPATYNEIENPPSAHLVVYTPCALQLDDAATGGQLTITANMAIFAAGGFFFDNWNTPAVTGGGSCTSASPCDVYFVVPCNSSCDNSGAGPFPANGLGAACPTGVTASLTSLSAALSTSGPISALPVSSTSTALPAGATVYTSSGSNVQSWTLTAAVPAGATSLPVSAQTPNYAYGRRSSVTYQQLDGDILMTAGVDGSTLKSFFYTPDNFCASGTPGSSGDPITGQIYVGGYVELSSQLFLKADTSLGSIIATAPSGYNASVLSMG